MFKFKIFEMPEGKSERVLTLRADSLDLGKVTLISGSIRVEFDRSPHFVLVKLLIKAGIEVICDRSLDSFEYNVHQGYEILFKDEEIEESADENGAIRSIDNVSKQINIEQDVLDTILVSLPAKKLHSRYLDEEGNPEEFLEEKFGVIEEKDAYSTDPRWDVLKELNLLILRYINGTS